MGRKRINTFLMFRAFGAADLTNGRRSRVVNAIEKDDKAEEKWKDTETNHGERDPGDIQKLPVRSPISQTKN